MAWVRMIGAKRSYTAVRSKLWVISARAQMLLRRNARAPRTKWMRISLLLSTKVSAWVASIIVTFDTHIRTRETSLPFNQWCTQGPGIAPEPITITAYTANTHELADGSLFEMDGRKAFPIHHGSTSRETLLTDAGSCLARLSYRECEICRVRLRLNASMWVNSVMKPSILHIHNRGSQSHQD